MGGPPVPFLEDTRGEIGEPGKVKPFRQSRPPVQSTVAVRFAKSAVTAEWSRDKGTLLELAEMVGLAPVFGCRSGICGTCATRITSCLQ